MSISQESKAIGISTAVVLVGMVIFLVLSNSANEMGLVGDTSNHESSNSTSIDFSTAGNTQSKLLDRNLQDSSDRTTRTDVPIKLDQNTSYIDAMKEIAARISEGQYEEGENELNALVWLIDPLPDYEKYAFLEYFIEYSQNNAFNPEVISAFDALWSNLAMDLQTKLNSAKLLTSHYANTYEFAFAIDHFNVLTEFAAEIDAELYRDIAYAQFGMGRYLEALPNLIEHIDLQSGQGFNVDRREYSMLFESYYRTDNFREAELVGNLILDHYNDIQDWKDMQQFYVATGNESGLESLLSRADDLGLLNPSGEWFN